MNNRILKVKDHPGLIRDKDSNAILASDINMKRQFEQEQRKKFEMDNLPKRIEKLENDLDQIKNLLIILVSEKSKE